jgi:PKD repeat protein
VYKGGNSPTAGTLLLEQDFEAPASAAGGALVTLPLQHPQQFKQGDIFWVVFYYSSINQPQGYNTNTPNPGRNFYSPDGSSWSALESAGGGFASSTYIIRALEMPQWLSVSPGTGQVAGGSSLQHEVTVNASGLQNGKYKGKVQVMTNDPDQPLITVEVSMQLEDSPVAGFAANKTEVIPGETVSLLNLSKNADAYEWEFKGASPESSTLDAPNVVYSKPGKYKVSLKAKSTQTGRVSEALVKEDYVVIQNTLCHNLNYPFTGAESLATNDGEYITGTNKQGDKAKVNYFDFDRPEAYVTGIKVKFGFAVVASPDATIIVAVWDVDASSGEPRKILASKEVKLADVAADIASGQVTNVEFDAPVRLTGSFFAGVLLNTEEGNAVAIVHNDNRDASPGIAWTQDSRNNWASLGTVWPNMAYVALYVQPAVTQTLTPLVANFTISSESVCVGQQVQLDASSTVGAVRYEWLLEGAVTTTSTAVNPVATYATAGTYRITLKAYDSCSGVIVTTKEINIEALPDAAVTVSGSTTLCEGEKVTLSAVAGDDLTYRWSNGATTCSIEVSTSGEYTVTVTNATNCTTTSEAVVVKVNPLPVARIVADGSTTFCEGEKVKLSAPDGDAYTYRWSNGATSRTIEVGTAGSYTVTVTNTSGCAATSEAVVVSVNALPVAQITASGATTFCEVNNVVLTASEGNSYVWSNGATTRSITVAESGTYTVSVTNSNGCAATSQEVRTIVNPLPDKPLVHRDDIMLTSAAATGNQWYRNNMALPGATGSIYEAMEPGLYQVLVTSASGCSSEMSEQVKVAEMDLVTNLKVYPNPGNGLLNITFTGLRPDLVNVRVFDMIGKQIYEGKKSMLDEREFQIDISTAGAGVYMLQIQHKTSNYNRRIVVQH